MPDTRAISDMLLIDMRRLFLFFSVVAPIVVFADPPPISLPSPIVAPSVSFPVPLPVLAPSFPLTPIPAPSLPHIPYPYVTPVPPGRPVSSVDAVRMANLAIQQGRVSRYLDPVLAPLNRNFNVPAATNIPSTSRVLFAPNPADFELIFEQRRSVGSLSIEEIMRGGVDSLTTQKFISSAAANDAANLARLYADSAGLDPATMTDAQRADTVRFVAQFKALQVAYRTAWEKSVAGKSSAPDPAKPYQQALFALNRILQEAYATTKPGSDERAGITTFLMRVAQHAPIDSFISTYLVPKTALEMLAEASEKGEATVVDASGPRGADTVADALKDVLASKKIPDPAGSDWNIASTLGFYGLELRYFPSASIRPGRDVQVVIIRGPHAGHYMWLADYIRAGYPRDF